MRRILARGCALLQFSEYVDDRLAGRNDHLPRISMNQLPGRGSRRVTV